MKYYRWDRKGLNAIAESSAAREDGEVLVRKSRT